MGNKPRIRPREDGPLLVEGVPELTALKGGSKVAVPGGKAALCRCGGSKNKPFCDRTHAKNGFTSAKAAGRAADWLEHYEGRDIVIHDNRGTCAHAGYCTDDLKKVFKLGEEPWIDPDGAAAEAVKETIRRCPSGALFYTEYGEMRNEWGGPPLQAFAANGPYVFKGGATLEAEFGEGATPDHFTLCRCGRSKNKPFCDGSHRQHPFED